MVVLLRRQFLIGIHYTMQLAGIVLSGIGFRIGMRNFGFWDTLPLGNMAFLLYTSVIIVLGYSFVDSSHDGLEPAPGHALNARPLLPCLSDLREYPPALVYAAHRFPLLIPTMRSIFFRYCPCGSYGLCTAGTGRYDTYLAYSFLIMITVLCEDPPARFPDWRWTPLVGRENVPWTTESSSWSS